MSEGEREGVREGVDNSWKPYNQNYWWSFYFGGLVV